MRLGHTEHKEEAVESHLGVGEGPHLVVHECLEAPDDLMFIPGII